MVAILRFFIVVWSLSYSVLSQGSSQLTLSLHPVCNGENVTLTITVASGFQLLRLLVDAFNGTLNKGFLFCQVMPPNSTGVGVFASKTLNGWPSIPIASTKFSVTLTANPSLELDYNATVTVFESATISVLTLASAPARLLVYVSPSSLQFLRSPIIFNDSDSGVITCSSHDGKPAAALSLAVIPVKGEPFEETATGNVSVTLSSRRPLSQWHKAVATCRVTNNNCSISNVTDEVIVNYIYNSSVPDVIYRNESVVLNCSTYIRYYPGVQYNWTVPPAVRNNGSLYLEWITVPQGHFGSFYCTATNNASTDSVVIVFTVSNLSRPITPANNGYTDSSGCELCWIIGLALGIFALVAIAVVLGVLCKRWHFSKGSKSSSSSEMHHPGVCDNGRSNAAKLHSVDREYDSLDTQRSSEPTYSQLILEHISNSSTLYENFKSSKR